MLPPWLGYVNGKGDGTVTSVTMLCYIKFLPYRLEGETLPLALKKQTACSEPACGERTIRLGASRPYPARISSQADTSKWKPKCESVNCSVLSDCLQLHALQPTRIFSPWNSPGKNTGVGGHFFSRISSQPRIEPRSPALGADSLPSEPREAQKQMNPADKTEQAWRGFFLIQAFRWEHSTANIGTAAL